MLYCLHTVKEDVRRCMHGIVLQSTCELKAFDAVLCRFTDTTVLANTCAHPYQVETFGVSLNAEGTCFYGMQVLYTMLLVTQTNVP
jgi:hypothetical protein